MLLFVLASCTDAVEVGSDLLATNAGCEAQLCDGVAMACGDCSDNDSDGLVDLADPDCLGVCQTAEDTFFVAVSLQNQGRCSQDCYFDDDSGFGNDGCSWSHHCDELSIAPDFPPEGEECAYAPVRPIQGSSGVTCISAIEMQPTQCLESCLTRTPPGCDCFGCCVFPEAATAVWIGSNDGNQPTCTRDSVADPQRCRPCSQVPSCLGPLL